MKFIEGQTVVYSKTGTEGRIVRFHELDGKAWAELDTTGLLYEESALEPKVEGKIKKATRGQPKEEPVSSKEPILPDIKDEGRLDGSGTVGGGG